MKEDIYKISCVQRQVKHQATNIIKLTKTESGEGYIDIIVIVLCIMLVVALAVKVLPVFIEKNQLDVFASELCREAEIAGRVGSETTIRTEVLKENTGLDPEIIWSKTGKIQLNEEFTVTVSIKTDIGLFGSFGSFPITLKALATGKSEVYWK